MQDTKIITIIGAAIVGLIIVVVAIRGFDEPNEAASPTNLENTMQTPTETPAYPQFSTAPDMQLEEGKTYVATLKTNKGDIVIDLYETEVPNTVNNFVFLANQGFYKNVPFHRVISGFMLQTGDPSGTGAGGPGYRFDDEEFTGEYTRGTVAMANAGPNTNGSQFFIMHADWNDQAAGRYLPPNYVIFGVVTEGLDVVDAIASVPVELNRYGNEQSTPSEDVFIEDVTISVN